MAFEAITGSARSKPGIRTALTHAAIVVLLVFGCSLHAEDHTNSLDGPQTAWRRAGPVPPQLVAHAIDGTLPEEGTGCEVFQFAKPRSVAEVALIYPLPRSVRIGETAISLWMKSLTPGGQVALRLRFPKQVNAKTGQPHSEYLLGSTYDDATRWQELTCDASDEAFRSLVLRLRNQFQREMRGASFDERDAYIDQVAVLVTISSANSANRQELAEIRLDNLKFGPLVPVANAPSAVDERPEMQVPKVSVRDSGITREGRPFFPLMFPHHGESIETLMEVGHNVVWLPQAANGDLEAALIRNGFSIAATPPSVSQVPDAEKDQAGLLPFGPETSPVQMWMLDVRLPANSRDQVVNWIEQIRDADLRYRRPIIGDVAGAERQFHRQLSALGVSRFIPHSSRSPRDLFEYLEMKRRHALPGKPLFTFIPTEPADEVRLSRATGSIAPIIEPEQLWQMGWIPLAAGYRGLAFWSHVPLDDPSPAAVERRHALALFNAHVKLLEPWLATAEVAEPAEVRVGGQAKAGAVSETRPNLDRFLTEWDRVSGEVRPTTAATIAEGQIEASVLETDHGLLVLVQWLDNAGQHQPGAMVAENVNIFVKRDVMQAWLVSPTAILAHPLKLTRTSGGTIIALREFQQFAAILIPNPNERSTVDALQREIGNVRANAAQHALALAQAKLARVKPVHAELVSLGSRCPHGDGLLQAADRDLNSAREELARGNFNEASDLCGRVLRHTRIVQREHWGNAVTGLTLPVANPYAISFQTLPDYWRFQRLWSSAPASQNLLGTGDFEEMPAMLAAGWTRQTTDAGSAVLATAELAPNGLRGSGCLRLAAGVESGQKTPLFLDQSLVAMRTPLLSVGAGQVVRISGQFRIPNRLSASTDGFTIEDTLSGPTGALRFRSATPQGDWQAIEILRESSRTTVFQVSLDLRALGEVLLDNFQVEVLEASTPIQQVGGRMPK